MAFKRNIFFKTTRITVLSLFAAAAIAIIVLAGWVFQVDLFQSFYPGWASMKVNGALAILLAAGSLLLFLIGKNKHFAILLSAFVFLIGAVTLSEYLFHWNASVDELLFRDTITPAENNPGRMSLATSLAIVMLGASLLLYRFNNKLILRITNILASISFFIGFAAFAGYLYNAGDLYKEFGFTTISLPSTLALMLISAAVFFSRPGSIFLSAFNKPTLAGKTGFRGAMLTIVIIFIISWLRVEGQKAGLFSTGLGMSLMIIAFIISIFFLTWWKTTKLNIAEEEKDKLLKLVRDSDDYNRSILSSLKASIAVIDETGNVVTVNKAWESFAAENGVTTLERVAIGANYFSVCNNAAAAGDEIAAQAIKGIQSVLQKEKKVFELQYPCHSPSTQRWFLLRVMPFESERPMAVVSHNDITDIVLAKNKVEESERDLMQVMNNSSGMIASIDRLHRLKVFNSATSLEYALYCGKELKPGMVHYEAFPPDAQAIWKAKIDEALAGKTATFERNYEIGGKKKYTEISLFPIRKGNDVEGVTCFIADITERKLAEFEKEESRQKYFSIFENSADGILLTIPDGNVLAANKAACEIFGMTEEEICNAGRNGLVDINDPNLPALLQERRITGRASGELTFKRKDGTKFSGEITTVIFKDASGNERSSMIIRDISARKAAEKLVKISEARLKKAQQVAHVGSWYLDFRNNSMQWSDETYRIFGVSPHNYSPTIDSSIQLVHPDDQIDLKSHLNKFFGGTDPGDLQFRILLPDGSVRYVNGRGDLKFDKEGKPVSITGTVQDITSMKLAEQKIQESEKKLRGITASLPGVVYQYRTKPGEKIEFTFLSDGISRFNEKTDDIYKDSSLLLSRVHPDDIDRIMEILSDSNKEMKPATTFFRLLDKEEKYIWMRSDSVPEKLEDGTIVRNGSLLDITAAKEAEQKLQESEMKFKNLVENIHESLMVEDVDGNLLYANSEFSKVFGYSENEFKKLNLRDYTAPECVEEIMERHNKRMQGLPVADTFEYKALRKDGKEIWIDCRVTLLKENGKITGTQSLERDITERKLAQQKLAESEAKYRSLMQQAGDATIIFDLHGNIIEVNDSSVRLLGYSQYEFKNMHLWDFVFEFDLKEKPFHFDELNKGISTITRRRLKKKDGAAAEVEIHAKKLSDGIFLAVGRDLTERIKAEEQLRESEKKYRSIVEKNLAGIYQTTTKGKILTCNTAFARMLGYTVEFLQHQDAGILYFSKTDRKEFISLLRKNEELMNQESILKHRDGSPVYIVESCSLVKDSVSEEEIIEGVMIDITKRKKAEQALTESEETFRRLFDESADSILLLDDTGFTECNQAAATILGYSSPQEVLIKQPWEISPERQPDGRLSTEKAAAMIAKALKKGYNRFEWIHTKADGTEFPVEVMLTPIILKGKQCFYTVWRDIAERKKAEHALAESENRYRSLVQQASDGILLSDLKGNILEVNAALCSMFGYKKEEALQKKVTEFLDAGELKMKPIRLDLLQRGHSILMERRVIHKNGNLFDIELSSKRIGEGIILSTIRDISERKKALEQIRLSEEKYRSFFDQSADAIFVFDKTGHFLDVNSVSSKLLGYTRKELVNMSVFDIVYKKDLAANPVRLDLLATGETVIRQRTFKRKNGTPVEVEVHSKKLPDGNYLGLVRDITEWKKAETVIKESEAKFRTIVDTSGEMMQRLSLDGKIIWVNESWKKNMGFTDKEVTGKKLSDFLDEATKVEFAKVFPQLMKGKKVSNLSCGFVTKNGAVIYLEGQALPVISDGKVTGSQGFLRNVTERKKAEDQLRESERFLSNSQSVSKIGSYVLDFTTGEWKASSELDNILGFTSKDKHTISAWISILHPEHKKLMEEYLRKEVMAKKQRFNKEYKIINKKTGHECWVHGIGDLELNAKGDLVKMIGTIQDISERKKTEELIRENENRFRSLVDSAPDATVIVDEKGMIQMANQQVVKLLGYSKSELNGMSVEKLIPQSQPGRQNGHRSKNKSNLNTRLTETEGDSFAVRKDGMKVPVEISLATYQSAGGTLITASLRDITERKKAEKELEESYRSIRHLTEHLQNVREEERTHIAREIHDELGQQLTVMMMDISWLSNKIEPGNAVARKKINELLDLIGHTVKTVRRISTELRPSVLDDLGLAAAMELHLKEFEKRSGIQTRLTISKPEPNLAGPVKNALFRIFQESLTNVARHSGANKTIVKLEKKNKNIVLMIEDNGVGFDKHKAETKRTLGVLGMKERAVGIGGEYQISGTPGKGTVILVNIPLNGTLPVKK